MPKSSNPFAERFKKVDGGKASIIASAWEEIVKESKSKPTPEPAIKSTSTETNDMVKISLWVPKSIKNDIDDLVKKLKESSLSRPFAKPSVIIRESIEVGYPKIKEHLLGLFSK